MQLSFIEKFKKVSQEIIDIDSLLNDYYQKYKDIILENTQIIRSVIDSVIENNYYNYCLRGVFGATILDIKTNVNHGYAFNMPSLSALEICRFSDDQCTKMLTSNKHGAGYDLCPSRHARERLKVSYISENNFIWVEAGSIYDNKKFQYWNINELPNKCYPCIRCLTASSLENVNILAALNKNNGVWDVSFHDVNKHLEFLMLNKIIEVI